MRESWWKLCSSSISIRLSSRRSLELRQLCTLLRLPIILEGAISALCYTFNVIHALLWTCSMFLDKSIWALECIRMSPYAYVCAKCFERRSIRQWKQLVVGVFNKAACLAVETLNPYLYVSASLKQQNLWKHVQTALRMGMGCTQTTLVVQS